jgi:hypothetical protein
LKFAILEHGFPDGDLRENGTIHWMTHSLVGMRPVDVSEAEIPKNNLTLLCSWYYLWRSERNKTFSAAQSEFRQNSRAEGRK